MKMKSKAVLFLAALLTVPMASQAALIHLSYDITASGYGAPGDPNVVDPAHLQFALDFDNTVDVHDETTGLTVLSTNLLPGTVAFGYSVGSDLLSIGTSYTLPTCFYGGDGKFCMYIHDASTAAPQVDQLSQWGTSVDGRRFLYNPTSQSVSAVPEPGTLALAGLAFAGFGLTRRRRAS